MSKFSNIEALENYFKKVTSDLKSDQAQKQIRASGESANSLKYSASELSGQLKGADYSFFQIVGRRPGKGLPFDPTSTRYGYKTRGPNKGKPRGDYPDLSEWADNKPDFMSRVSWTILKPYERLGILYSVSENIKEEGTNIYTGKRPGLSFDEITGGENLQTLIESIKDRKVAEIITFMKADLTGKTQTA